MLHKGILGEVVYCTVLSLRAKSVGKRSDTVAMITGSLLCNLFRFCCIGADIFVALICLDCLKNMTLLRKECANRLFMVL